jgi:hypothetical protein
MLPWAQYWYNTSFHHSLGMSPFQAVFGRSPPTILRYELDNSDPISVQELLVNRDKLLSQLRATLLKSQNYMKQQADKRRRDLQLQVGDYALVWLQPYRQQSLALRMHQKLGMKYFGPFEVLQKIGSVAYKLKLPEAAKIHPMFHISLLKLFKGNPHQQYLPMPLTTSEFGPITKPIRVQAWRVITRQGKPVSQLLIQWDLSQPEDATWEDLEDIRISFPDFNLEDKVNFDGEGNVTCIKEECKLVRNSGHVAAIPQGKETRKSTRSRKENVLLRDYVH